MAKYSKDYKSVRDMFWNGKEGVKTYGLDEEGIEYCLFRALKDYTARTEKKKENDATASAQKMLEALKDNGFLNNFESYFTDDIKDSEGYDKWHHACCEEFISIIKDAKIRSNVSYGKAQKIVNMTMKTVYCLKGSEEKANAGYFEYCHMPLDSFTLEWFRAKLAKEWYNPSKARTFKIKISTDGGPLPKWSNLNFKKISLETNFDTYDRDINTRLEGAHYHYMFFVTLIRAYFAPNNSNNPYHGLTPFQAEFYIWPEIQWEMSAKNIVDQDLINKVSIIQGLSTNNTKIKELCVTLKEQAETLLTIY